MESYGELLKKARVAKELSFEQIERETTITKQYIDALEAEEVDIFPGEPYMIGFLKNYAEYLGINSEEILRLYHAKKIQESPVPRELLEKKRPKFLVPLIITLIVLLLAGTGVYLYFFVFKVPQRRAEKALQQAESKQIHQYEIEASAKQTRVYVGDQLIVPAKSGNIVLTVSQTLGQLFLQTPTGKQKIDLAEERALDIDGDDETDVIFYLWDVSNTDENRGAEIRMKLSGEGDDLLLEETVPQSKDITEPPQPAVQQTSSAAASAHQKVLLESTYTYPFTVNVRILKPCLLRYRVDSDEKVERYFEKDGETIPLNARYRGVRLWMSNHAAVQIQVLTSDGRTLPALEVGKAGQVQVESIKWVGPRNGKYYIVVEDVD